MWVRFSLLVLAVLWSLSGCGEQERITIEVGEARAMVELASKPEERRKGLMGRTALTADQGMLMVFPSSAILEFWMLNTEIPLDVGFFDAQGRLLGIVSMRPDGGKQIHASPQPALYALEMNMGWFERHGIEPGVLLKLPYPIQGR